MTAEAEYLFRHALLQEAAYSLQLPSERGMLHGLVVDSLERLLPPGQHAAHALDMARHAGCAALDHPEYAARELAFLQAGEKWAANEWRLNERIPALARIAEHPLATEFDRRYADCERGMALRLLGRNAEAEQLLVPLQESPHLSLRASALNQLAAVYLRTARVKLAQATFRRAHEAAVDAGEPRIAARVLANIALTQFELHEIEGCAQSLDDAARAAEQMGDPGLRAQIHGHRGRLYHHGARPADAEAEYRQAITLADNAGDRATKVNATANLAELQRQHGRPDAAARLVDALSQGRAIGDRHLEMMTLGNYALLLQDQDKLAEARQCQEQAYAMALELGDKLECGLILSNLSNVLFRLGDLQGCDAAAGKALHIAHETGSFRLEAAVYLARGQRGRIRADLQHAMQLGEQAGDELLRQSALEALQKIGNA